MSTNYSFTNLLPQHRLALSVPSNADAAHVREDDGDEFMVVASLSNAEYIVYGDDNEVILKAHLFLGTFKDALTGSLVGYWECVDANGSPQGIIEERGPLGGLLSKSRWYRIGTQDLLVFRRNQNRLNSSELGIVAARPKLWSTDVETLLCRSRYITFPMQILLVFMFWQENLPS